MKRLKPIHSVLLASGCLLLLAGCDDFPADPEGTMKQVQTSGVMRTGIVSGPGVEAEERRLAARAADAAGARPQFEEGSSEVLLRRLEKGELDVVFGQFAKASPMKEKAAFTASPEAKSPPSDEPVMRAAVALGENRWLMFLSAQMKKERADEAGS
ncbi:hypothetical protein [Rhizobium sp. L1K21]|uniref:hypothetical protein n=1 Tax=Rhizobium sp. L1K21 TaxID=2954933 RepID=UPI00209363D8|nr:hypothetical protein [Rhizobium sp. L1K21]MCO6187850.1 hypothetical protein [Rhizobium sp. L1K21]